ncbi:TonB-denpendent receptor (plasmid) [Kozakia baliensis]|uniref:TonB-denpendent receptor n=1 Tax=Kozakia baliensis TaxID=153496 RepID=UPI00345C5792
MNVNAGYCFKDMNIANNHYLGFVTGTATNARATTGVFGSNIAGASTSTGFNIASPFSVLGTASTES